MARFVFRMQSVLDIKARLEDQQKMNFAAAQKRLNEEEETLAAMVARRETYEAEGRRLRDNDLNIRDLIDNENSINVIKEFIETQTRQVEAARKALDEERLKLVDAMRERKTYEKLREKAFDAFVAEENHKEGVENDEHNSFVYGKRQLGEEA